jgi:hypothetical protein
MSEHSQEKFFQTMDNFGKCGFGQYNSWDKLWMSDQYKVVGSQEIKVG